MLILTARWFETLLMKSLPFQKPGSATARKNMQQQFVLSTCRCITLLITVNNYKWTWQPSVGSPALTRKC